MDGQLFLRLYRRLLEIANIARRPREQHADVVIVAVYLWGVIHDRPQGWGCHVENWTIELPWLQLPSESLLSRRLNTRDVRALLGRLCDYLWGRFRKRLAKCIDGRPLAVSASSKDKTATRGHTSGGKTGKGYKLHVIIDGGGVLIAWIVAPLHQHESVVARKLVRRLENQGYLIGDSNYDYNKLYIRAACYGHQLVAPRKKDGQMGHCFHSQRRHRGLHLLKQPFGAGLMKLRKISVERFFGNLGWRAGGLSQLPGFVRSYRRVQRWVESKLILQGLKMEKSLELQR